MKIQKIENVGLAAVLILRKTKLAAGYPFMINAKELPSRQFYLEFPDGHIELTALNEDRSDYKVVQKYTQKQSDRIRKKYNLV